MSARGTADIKQTIKVESVMAPVFINAARVVVVAGVCVVIVVICAPVCCDAVRRQHAYVCPQSDMRRPSRAPAR